MAPNWTAIARRIGLLGSDYESEVFAAANTRRRCLKAELRMVIRCLLDNPIGFMRCHGATEI
jgi:hypothetical protein